MENELKLDKHISKKYNADLEDLRENVMNMGGMVEEQLGNSLESLVKADIKLAKSVIKKDTEVNQIELNITARCTEILALRQPTASDLRLIITVEKMITDLERIGDLSESLARLSKKLISKGVSTRYYEEILHVGNLAQKMLKKSLDAFARLDAECAIDTMSIENEINRESTALSRQLITYMMEDPRSIKHTLRVLNAAKALERIGDHCENLCEYIVYLVKGEDIRYQNLDEIRAHLLNDED
ncbi:MAG: phosphate signaling complex protein PhoU [Gammaproteobacteria bacterium]|nr:phosphate signaling complex protein PhoU [Gammaproteobacteria bacterium]